MKNPMLNFTAADKDAARQKWNDRFNNRTPTSHTHKKIDVRAAASDTTEIFIYEEIGWFGISAKDFIDILANIATPRINVRLNSPGGDVFDGIAIYNALKAHPAEITCQVDGLAASAASFIALAGKKVVMADNALLMAHKAWGIAIGNMSDMLETAMILEKIDAQLAGIYSKKTGKPSEECAAMMAGEDKRDGTWFTAEEAKAYGLVDEIMMMDAPDEEHEAAAAMRVKVLAMKRRLAIAERD